MLQSIQSSLVPVPGVEVFDGVLLLQGLAHGLAGTNQEGMRSS